MSSSRHPLGAVCCNSEGRGCSHVPRYSKIVWKTRRASPREECDPNWSPARRGARPERPPPDNVSHIRSIVSAFALTLRSRVCSLPWAIVARLHAAAFGDLRPLIPSRERERFGRHCLAGFPGVSTFAPTESQARGEGRNVLLKKRRELHVRLVGEGRCWERGGGGRKDKFRHEREKLFGARGEPRC